ncbi:MAG: COG1470 family protein [Planctomycetota bacterium]
MKSRLLPVMICLFFAASAAANNDSLQVRPASEPYIEASPKQVSSLTVRITNNDVKNYEVVSEVTLPPGWALITEHFPFDLAPNQSLTKMISFFIPESTLPGRYKVTYMLSSKRYPEIRDFYTFDIYILPEDRLDVIALEGPQFIKAGTHYQSRFLVANKSNRKNLISITAKSSHNFPFTIDNQSFNLSPNQAKKVTVVLTPAADISRMITHRIELTASIDRPGKTRIRASSSSLVDVIPKSSKAQQIVRTIVAPDNIAQITGRQYETQLAFTPAEINEPGLAFVQAVPNPSGVLTQKGGLSKKKMLISTTA